MDLPEISILLCTYNRAAQLPQVLASLVGAEADGLCRELVVVDDGSSDDTRAVVEAAAARSPVVIRYVREDGVGVAGARNRCLREARGEWLAFFDDDQIAEPSWLCELLACARQRRVWYVGGQRVLDLEPAVLGSLSTTSRALLGELLWSGRPHRAGRKDVPAMGSVLIHQTVFQTIGGFDESLIRGGEDLDLFRRARAAGYEIWNTPRSVCRHRVPEYRLQEPYLLWVSRRIGENFACRDAREWGPARRFAVCAARLGRAWLLWAPSLAWAWATKNQRRRLESRCLLTRTAGYLRHHIADMAPNLASSKGFLDSLEFRSERKDYGSGIADGATAGGDAPSSALDRATYGATRG